MDSLNKPTYIEPAQAFERISGNNISCVFGSSVAMSLLIDWMKTNINDIACHDPIAERGTRRSFFEIEKNVYERVVQSLKGQSFVVSTNWWWNRSCRQLCSLYSALYSSRDLIVLDHPEFYLSPELIVMFCYEVKKVTESESKRVIILTQSSHVINEFEQYQYQCYVLRERELRIQVRKMDETGVDDLLENYSVGYLYGTVISGEL